MDLTSRMGTLRRRWLLATAAVAVLVSLALAPAAFAHPYLIASTPQGGIVAQSAPTKIQLAFTEKLVIKGCSIRITLDGKPVKVGPIHPGLGGEAMTATVPKLAQGVYTVSWVAYGNDGHTVEGGYKFGVPNSKGQPPAGAARLLASTTQSAEQAPTESLISVAGRWLAALAAFALLGGAALFLRLRGKIDDELLDDARSRWLRYAPAALGLALVGSLAEAIKRADGPHGLSLSLLTGATSGVSIVIRLGVLIVGAPLAYALSRGERPVRRLLATGLVGALTLSALAIDGHVATVQSAPVLAGIGMVAHLLSGGIWMGAVLVLALCLVPAAGVRSDALLRAVRAYTPVVVVAAAVTIATGIIAAIREVSRWYFLRWSSYGHVLIIKVVIVGGVLIVGGVSTLLARRALRRAAGLGGGSASAPGGLAGGAVAGRPTPDFALGGGGAAAVSSSEIRRAGYLMRVEAGMAIVTIAVAALLAGTLQGRGQTLPSQRGNLLPGAGFADVALQGATGQLTLAPAQVGLNRIVVQNVEPNTTGSKPPPAPKSVTVAFACGCSGGSLSFHATLRPGSAGPTGPWSAEVALPRDGTYSAELTENGKPTVGTPTFTVGDVHSAGSRPVEVASVADLSGPDAQDCRSQELGALTAIELMNTSGGINGNKLHQVVMDDQGSPSVARAEALQLAKQHPVAFLAPCGQAAQGAVEAVGNHIPTIVADDDVPLTAGKDVFRFAPNPYSEGYAAGQYVGKIGLPSAPSAPKQMAAFSDGSADSVSRIAGLRSALRTYGISLDVYSTETSMATLEARLKSALPADQYIGMYIDSGNLSQIAQALSVVGAETDDKLNPTPILVSQRLANERFVIDSGDLGIEGQIRAFADVDPTTPDASLYAELAPQVVGELATMPGLEGFVAGQALAYGMVKGDSVSDITGRLKSPGIFSKIATSPWDSRDPAAGTLIFRGLLAQFLPDNLVPNDPGAPSEPYEGQFFEDGSWEPASPELFSPLPIDLSGGQKTTSSGTSGYGSPVAPSGAGGAASGATTSGAGAAGSAKGALSPGVAPSGAAVQGVSP